MADNTQTITLTAPDISCDHCVATVSSAARSVAGVTDVSASAETKVVTVAFDPEVTAEPAIREALDEAGYPAR